MAFTSPDRTATLSVFLPITRYANDPVFNIALTARLPPTIFSAGETLDKPDDENRARDREVKKTPDTIRSHHVVAALPLAHHLPVCVSYPFPRCSFHLCICLVLLFVSCIWTFLSSPVIHPTRRIYFVILYSHLPLPSLFNIVDIDAGTMWISCGVVA